jgi:hypothetical protein
LTPKTTYYVCIECIENLLIAITQFSVKELSSRLKEVGINKEALSVPFLVYRTNPLGLVNIVLVFFFLLFVSPRGELAKLIYKGNF